MLLTMEGNVKLAVIRGGWEYRQVLVIFTKFVQDK